jgi:membrane protease YdiL (CAAX protease family)
MWIPGSVALVFRILFCEGFADVGWRAGARRYWLWAIVGPLAFASFTYLCAGLSGQVSLAGNLSTQFLVQTPLLSLRWPVWAYGFPVAQLVLRLAAVVLVSFPVNLLYAFGEELGWRGYLQTRLASSGFRWSLLACGFIWAAWHMPLPFVFWIGYHQPLAFVVLRFIGLTLAGVFVGWLRLASGSVWVAAAMHTAHNSFYQSLYAASLTGPSAWLWAGETGIFSILAYGLMALWLAKTGRIGGLRLAAAKHCR